MGLLLIVTAFLVTLTLPTQAQQKVIKKSFLAPTEVKKQEPAGQPQNHSEFLVSPEMDATPRQEISDDQKTIPDVKGTFSGWSYYKTITVDNTTNASTLTDYSVLVIVNTTTLITEGKLNSDGSDIRFSTDLTNDLPYWIEPGIQNERGMNNDSTYIWVKVPEILSSTTTSLYMIYGNPTATAKSDISATFLFGDDFNDNSLDAAKWNVIYTNSGVVNEQNQRLEHNSPATNPESEAFVQSFQSFTEPVVLEMQFLKGGYVYRTVGLSQESASWTNSAVIDFQDYGLISENTNVDGVTTGISYGNQYWSTTYDPEYYLTVIRKPDGMFRYSVNVPATEPGGPLLWENDIAATMPLTTPLKVFTRDHVWASASGLKIRAEDNIRVRKYSSPEPTTTLSTEQNLVTDICIPTTSVYACTYMYFTNISTSGGNTNFNNTTDCSATSYIDYSGTLGASNLPNGSTTFSFTSYGYALSVSVWIDFNDDNVFDLTEQVIANANSGAALTFTDSFTVPSAAPTGSHKMRIRGEYQGTGLPSDPCNQLQYGETEDYSFTVVSDTSLPIVSTLGFGNVSANSANVDCEAVSIGGGILTARGVVWSRTSGPTLEINEGATNDGDTLGTYSSFLTKLIPNSTYYVRAYATNSFGTAYGDEVSFTTSDPSTMLFSLIGSAFYLADGVTQAFWDYDIDFTYVGTTGNESSYQIAVQELLADGEFKVREDHLWNESYGYEEITVLGDPGNFTQSYINLKVISHRYYEMTFIIDWISQTQSLSLNILSPTVSTLSANPVTENSAIVNGEVFAEGTSSVTAKGFCWGLSPKPSLADNSVNMGTGIGAYSTEITGLFAASTYHVRSYASNSTGTVYGNELSFTTPFRPSAVIKKTATVPIIDGVEDAIWGTANSYNIDNSYRTEAPTLGESGTTTWKGLWADEGIYILLQVNDDIFFPAYMGAVPTSHWDYDKPELYFDVNEMLTDGLGPYDGVSSSEYMGHYQFAPAFDESFIDGTSFSYSGITVAYKVTNPTYAAEYFIPFSKLLDQNGVAVDITDTLGFDVTLIDRDSEEISRQRAVWANTGAINENYFNMDGAGTILLEPLNETVSLPIDFEAGPYNFTNWGTASTTVIENPQANGINTSGHVAQLIKNTNGSIWDGSKIGLDSYLDFTTNHILSMKVFSTRTGVPIILKAENSDNTLSFEKQVYTQKANEWETLYFNFDGAASGVFNFLSFFFDAGNLGDGTANSTYLFDDITLGNVDPTPVKLTFNVDMSAQILNGLFIEATDVVYVTGNFNGWDEPGTGESVILKDPDKDQVYSVDLYLPKNYGEIQYKYFKNTTWSFGEWPGAPNRIIYIHETDTSTNDIYGIRYSSVILNPAEIYAPDLPSGMELVTITEGTFLKVTLNGWDSRLPLVMPTLIPKEHNRFRAKVMYEENGSGYPASSVRSIINVFDASGKYTFSANMDPAPDYFTEMSGITQTGWPITNLQFAAQLNTADWSAISNGVLYIGVIESYHEDVTNYPPNKTYSAKYLVNPLNFDGQLGEPDWNDAGVEVAPIDQIASTDGVHPTSASDNSANFRALWDKDNLYLFVDITDDYPIASANPDIPYFNDCVELFLDIQDRRYEGLRIPNEQHQIRFNLGNYFSGDTRFYTGFAPTCYSLNYGTGYTFELAIPWRGIAQGHYLGDNLEKYIVDSIINNKMIAFEISVSDADTENVRQSMLNWSNNTGSDLNWKTSRYYGRVVLSAGSGYPASILSCNHSNVTENSATLNAVVNANGTPTDLTFEYGITQSLNQSIAADPSTISGSENQNIQGFLNGLSTNTLYYYRLKAYNLFGSIYSDIQTFTTCESSIAITGLDQVNTGQQNVIYSVPAHAGATFKWTINGGAISSGAQSNQCVVNWGNIAGTGWIKIVKTYGDCSYESTKTVVISENTVTYTITGKTTVCKGAQGVTYSIPSDSYTNIQWSVTNGTIASGLGTNVITVDWASAEGTGLVSVNATANGTDGSGSLNVTISNSAIETPNIHVKSPGHANILICTNPDYSYQWYKDEQAIDNPKGRKQFYVARTEKGDYQVQISDKSGCSAISETEQISNLKSLNFYPNPASGTTTLSFESEAIGHMTLRLVSVYGKTIKQMEWEKPGDHLQDDISLDGIEKGVYMIEILVDGVWMESEQLIIN
ncbi:MAG: hypothetical protein A2W97_02885 [Bacteroidetes bacterium GWE2_40_63]|nr:MAG: hypothetical protein A2W97_02885 [Bacteroidetes bacterium GWE2_40_63]OFY20834.1 MAG: hypothetical protein A2W88_17380 [Bacteroidetes bacterium GWF2_40_13]